MDVILFEYLPQIIFLNIVGVLAYYFFILLYKMTVQVKKARTITGVVLCIIATLILSILLIFMVATAVEDIV